MPAPEDYRLLIEREWADLHHSRILEWTVLGVVAGAHLGLIQLAGIAADTSTLVTPHRLAILSGSIAIIFSILGALMTCRHRQLMTVKLGWIYQAEKHLGLIKTADNPRGIIPEDAEMTASTWKGLALPRLLSSSGLIFSFYIVLLIIDIGIVCWSVFAQA